MILASKKTLKNIAAFVWVIGGLILFLKSYSLLKQALEINFNYLPILAVIITGVILGLIKNKFIMAPFCKNNLIRIDGLLKPMMHQFYKLKFLLLLILMILTGLFLSKISEGNYFILLAVGCLDLALSTALLTSSVYYFKKN